jgi:hypothetical protein
MNWIRLYSRLFFRGASWAEETPHRYLPSNRLKAVMEMIDKTQENELTCAQVHVFLGEFVELNEQERSVKMPLVAHHLGLCRECLEEYQALARILISKQAGEG